MKTIILNSVKNTVNFWKETLEVIEKIIEEIPKHNRKVCNVKFVNAIENLPHGNRIRRIKVMGTYKYHTLQILVLGTHGEEIYIARSYSYNDENCFYTDCPTRRIKSEGWITLLNRMETYLKEEIKKAENFIANFDDISAEWEEHYNALLDLKNKIPTYWGGNDIHEVESVFRLLGRIY